MYPCEDMIWIDNSGFRPKGLIPAIVDRMVQAHEAGPKWENPIVQRARKWAVSHDWKKVTRRWVKVFKDATDMREKENISVLGEEI